jgi:quinate dehydrogenase
MTSASTASQETVCLFGDPVSQSLSPYFHTTVFRRLGLSWQFRVIESRCLHDLENVIKTSDFKGCAVTLPNKVAAMKLVDDLSNAAQIIGNVNTIYVRQQANKRILVGTNTDWIGMQRAILARGPTADTEIQNRGAVVIGGGALCRAAVYCLVKGLGARKVFIIEHDDDSELTETLSHLRKSGFGEEAIIKCSSLDQLRISGPACAPPAVIINTIPDELLRSERDLPLWRLMEPLIHGLNNGSDASETHENQGFILDIFCRQSQQQTKLVQMAKEAGWSMVSFLDFMAFQAIEQDVLWTETPIDRLVFEEVRDATFGPTRVHSGR